MKLNLAALFVAAQATTVLSAAAMADAPSGDGPYSVNGQSPSERDVLSPQACWTRSPYDCSESRWCWKQCGTRGEWCWTARNRETGPWKACANDRDCVPGSDDSDCGQGANCSACGCSC
ncbi:hypothetical protein BDV29DRAFT_133527 [Aspergillus leporis]|uniref:Uncharacterized protein n=1 Tax=Aspergillus leporis TaxID=41062 RepID=A0A5N5WZ90_9EURO|nr:hypothetical protein BDV29DRAFT_133527 [Aspergillus leporis]